MAEQRSIHELAKQVKAKYRKQNKIERLFYSPRYWLPIDQCYLHLSIIEEQIYELQKDDNNLKETTENKDDLEKTKEKLRYNSLHSYERIQYSQHILMPEQLLTECQHTPKRICIEGAAGAGKTTLSQFIAYQWSMDHPAWKHYDFLFRIRLRDLTSIKYKEDQIKLIDIIKQECFGKGHNNKLKKNERKLLNKYIKANPQKILFILDGQDELSKDNKSTALWESLIDSTYDIIITSRPGMQETKLETNLNVTVLGFSDEQVEKYVHYFFDPLHTPDAKPQDAHQCLQALRQNSNLWSLAHIPIQLELLCSMWGEKLQQTSDITLTHIYTLILEQLLKRYEQKRLKKEENKEDILTDIDIDPLVESTTVCFEFLENLAFQGMKRKDLVMPKNIIEDVYKGLTVKPKDKAAFFVTLRDLGLITRDSNRKQIEFIHLTFQEYFAARYIARSFIEIKENQKADIHDNELKTFIRTTIWENYYEIMYWFTAGLLTEKTISASSASTKVENQAKYLHRQQAFFDWLLEGIQHKLSAKELTLIVRCLAEARLPHIKQRDALINTFTQWYEFYWRNEDKYLLRKTELSQLETVLRQSPKIAKDYGAIKILTQALNDENDNIKNRAIINLGELAITTPEISQGLLKLLREGNELTQLCAAESLAKLNEQPFEIMETLINLQERAGNDDDFEFMINTSELLSKLIINEINNLSSAKWFSLKDILEGTLNLIRLYYNAYEVSQCLLNVIAYFDEVDDDDFYIENKAGIAEILGILNFKKLNSVIELYTKSFEKMLEANEDSLKELPLFNLDCLKQLNIDESYEIILNKLLELMINVNDEVRESAIKAIQSYMAYSIDYIENKLLTYLQDKNNPDYLRENAAQALVDLNISSPDISKILINLLKDENLKDKDWDSIESIIKIFWGSPLINSSEIDKIRNALVNLIDKKPQESEDVNAVNGIREGAARCLNDLYIKDYSKDEISILLACLKNDNNDALIRINIASLLIRLEQDRINIEVVEVLLNLFNTQSNRVKEGVLDILVCLNLATHEKHVVKEFLAFSSDENNDSRVRIKVAKILCNCHVITPQKNVEILLSLLVNQDRYIKEHAAATLVELNLTVHDEYVIKKLFEFSNDAMNSSNMRIKIIKILIKHNPNKLINEVVEILSNMLRVQSNYIADDVVKTLIEINKINHEVIQKSWQRFLILLKENIAHVRANAINAIVELNINNSEMISELQLLLKDTNNSIKVSALIALSKLNKLSLKTVVQEALILLEEVSLPFSVRTSLTDIIFNMPNGLYSFMEQCNFNQLSYNTIANITNYNDFIDTSSKRKEKTMEQNQPLAVQHSSELRLNAETTYKDLLQIITGQLNQAIQQTFLDQKLPSLKEVMANVKEEATFQSMLLLSAATGWKQGLCYLLTYDEHFSIYSGNQDNLNIIHLLAAANNLGLLSDNVASNFNFDQATKDGITPLHVAIQYGHTEAVDFLLNKKGVMQQSVKFYWDAEHFEMLTSFQLAIVKGHFTLVQHLLTQPQFIGEINLANGGNILHLAIKSHQNRILDLLLSQPLFTNSSVLEQEDRTGMKPLALAASLGNQQAILYLRQKGAQLNAPSIHYGQYMALHFAVETMQVDTVKLLVKIGAKLDSECQDQLHKEKKKRTAKGLAEHRAKQDHPPKMKNMFVAIKHFLDNARQQQEVQQFSQITIEKVIFKNLVFKGGGPKGLAYGGALEAFSQRLEGQPGNPFPDIERVAGTSAGAITAALIAIGCTPQQMKEILEKTKPIEFLEGHSLNILSENTSIFERISIISEKISELKDPLNLWHFVKSVYSGTALCKGDVFLNWIEQQIAKYTRIPHCTFSELRQLIETQSPAQPKYKHLHVATIKLGRIPDIEVLSSENPAYDHYVISSAIRASMSLPFIFEPHPLQGKVKNAHESELFIIDKTPHVDAGLIDNYPIREFDQAKYKYAGLHQFKAHQNPHYPVFNDETLGFYITPETEMMLEEDIQKISKLSLINGIKNIYTNAEEIMAKHYQDNTATLRTIPIDNAGVSLYDFDLTQEMQEALYTAGKKAVETSSILQSEKETQSKKKKVTQPKGMTLVQANPLHGFFSLPNRKSSAVAMEIEESNTNVPK